ncbi:MAG TPA: SRPBCC family protein [Gaiellales bacterium]|nr:SRPBCC family protein [Gaiellales bacterium]
MSDDIRFVPFRAADGGASLMLIAEQTLPGMPQDVFPFFSDALNLEQITPPWLRFRVLTPGPIELGEGTLIDYRLALHGVPLRWHTRITGWDPPHRFSDEQISGPYRVWKHLHTFERLDGGRTLARDRVEYRIRGGRVLQALAQRVLVERDLRAIFAYRRRRLAEIFPG